MNITFKGQYILMSTEIEVNNYFVLRLYGEIYFALFYISINKRKLQIIENEENLFFRKKCPGVGSDLE